MKKGKKQSVLFHDYFKEWIELYKVGAVRSVTLQKYWINHQWLLELAPSLSLDELDRKTYQKLLNDYAVTHERQTTMDFHHQIKGAILDAHDEGLLLHDPTRKVVIKGKQPAAKKIKYLNQFELRALLNQLSLTESVTWDWLILLIAKTGIRFSEALGLTPDDFDFSKQIITISKTWNYKDPKGGFSPTKNSSSVRKIQLDWQTNIQFSQLVSGKGLDQPIFVQGRVFNSTVNQRLANYCQKANIPIISIHGLRHTHASLLLYAGVSTASVARRLGHSNMTTTQQTYLHIIQELENQDNEKVMKLLSSLY
ncbi:site-specific integrase [Bacillus kwashiorkori]|uniref:site-specific integrase n=1 Tax=Bacillus kwashiorkori TaxID=1522318 RepID=UPI000785B990|nr:site-specific integrase [Bacillus kwashiorkori]